MHLPQQNRLANLCFSLAPFLHSWKIKWFFDRFSFLQFLYTCLSPNHKMHKLAPLCCSRKCALSATQSRAVHSTLKALRARPAKVDLACRDQSGVLLQAHLLSDIFLKHRLSVIIKVFKHYTLS